MKGWSYCGLYSYSINDKNIITKVCKRYNVGRPRVVVGVPSGITEVEERAVEEAVSQAWAREVF